MRAAMIDAAFDTGSPDLSRDVNDVAETARRDGELGWPIISGARRRVSFYREARLRRRITTSTNRTMASRPQSIRIVLGSMDHSSGTSGM
jgi:hypothetical protein